MTQEEKFEEAKRLYETANADQRYVLESLFPELAESEDERIRKALMQNLKERFGTKGNMGKGLDMPDVLAWLEKQGEYANFRNKIQIGDKVTRNEDGVLVNLSQLKRVAKPSDDIDTEKQGKNNMGISKATKKKLEDNLNKALEKETPESCNEFLEAQGEQKPLGFNIGDEITVNGQICKVVAVEQKPTDKVEPKFKVGDFVKNVNHHKQPIYKVVDIDKECYICISDDVTLGDNTVVHFTFDNPYLRLVEQKPAEWSEEDENRLSDAVFFVREYQIPTRDKRLLNAAKEAEEWLKSLKERYTWKPSKEQLHGLDVAITTLRCQHNAVIKGLDSLYMDLKKLRD